MYGSLVVVSIPASEAWKPLANTHARRAAGNEIEDEHRSAAAARLSEINLANYRVFA
ncbi:hypothetical protein [Rhizobium leguminosarum]|uniref:hypothetical protein n=1 Tax=Rhizobium leguminosarum TaxID=384 RepID=UPI0024B348B4|nr:hypothetical protein [Rhizobium leguminosarum]WHO81501.1 DUF3141 domain-containing protein [Rhizobium leguminosarum]